MHRLAPPLLPNMCESCRMQEPSCNSKSTHLKEAPKAASADIWASISTMNGRSNSSLKHLRPALAGTIAFPLHFCNIKLSTSSLPPPSPLPCRTQGRTTPDQFKSKAQTLPTTLAKENNQCNNNNNKSLPSPPQTLNKAALSDLVLQTSDQKLPNIEGGGLGGEIGGK